MQFKSAGPRYILSPSLQFVFFFLTDPVILPSADRTPLRRHKCFKKNELQVLHQAYLRDPHPLTDALQRLAIQLNVTVEKVRVSDFLPLERCDSIAYSSLLAMVQKSTP